MKAATGEWLQKAEGDYGSMLRDYRARKSPNYDGCCFHAQQCVEKSLKARLQEANVPFPKTHDLTALLTLVGTLEPSWANFASAFGRLTDAAVEVRYPGTVATKQRAKESIDIAKAFRTQARARLGLA
jgi:HEPN domain-containing protein